MTTLIGITGKARAGKDTFAKGLIASGYSRASFAEALKLVTATIANEPTHLYHDDVSKEEPSEALGMARRLALQKVGSAVRESLGKQTWVNRVLRQWEANGKLPLCITDCRYDNEAEAIIAAGGVVIRVERPEFGGGLTGEAAQHESENGVSEHLVEITVRNDGSSGELVHEAHKIADYLKSAVKSVG